MALFFSNDFWLLITLQLLGHTEASLGVPSLGFVVGSDERVKELLAVETSRGLRPKEVVQLRLGVVHVHLLLLLIF